MIFAHQNFEKRLEWNENIHICELIIENPITLRNILQSITNATSESALSFTQNGEPLKLEKDVDIVLNPTKLEFNNRRATASLLKLLVKTSLSEDFYLETSKIKTKIIQYLDKVIDAEDFIFEVTSDDFAIDDIAKAVSLHIVSDDDDFIEILTDYLAMMAELANIKLFIFLNLRSLITQEELVRLHHNLKNHQIDALLIEDYDRGVIKDAPRIIIDRDNCEL